MEDRVICVMARMLDQEDGLGVYARNLLAHLLPLDPCTRYLILLPSAKNARAFAEHPNADVRVVHAPLKTLWDQVAVPLVARRENADLIFNPKFSVPLLSRRPKTFVLQGSDWYVNPQNYQWWDNLYIRLTLPLYLRAADRLLAISETVVADLSKYVKIDPGRVTVTYAAPAPHFNARRNEEALAEFRREYRLPERFIFTVARTYHTGHGKMPEYPGGNNERLLRAYRRYRERGGTLPLVVAGRDIDRYLRRRGFDDAALEGVHFTGFIPHERIHMGYQLAEFFVLVTLNESFAFPLVESLACGCPAIVPATGACPEIGGDAVRLVDPYDEEDIAAALTELASSPERRDALRSAGLRRVKRFRWELTAQRTLTVFDTLAPRRALAA